MSSLWPKAFSLLSEKGRHRADKGDAFSLSDLMTESHSTAVSSGTFTS